MIEREREIPYSGSLIIELSRALASSMVSLRISHVGSRNRELAHHLLLLEARISKRLDQNRCQYLNWRTLIWNAGALSSVLASDRTVYPCKDFLKSMHEGCFFPIIYNFD